MKSHNNSGSTIFIVLCVMSLLLTLLLTTARKSFLIANFCNTMVTSIQHEKLCQSLYLHAVQISIHNAAVLNELESFGWILPFLIKQREMQAKVNVTKEGDTCMIMAQLYKDNALLCEHSAKLVHTAKNYCIASFQ